jgi:carboxypeptidase family protein
MITWEAARRQIAIAGSVTDAQTGRPIGGARVTITAAPAAFTARRDAKALQAGARWETMAERPDRTHTAVDGQFRFLDLPAGRYTLSVSLPGAGTRYGSARAEARVSREAEGRVTMASVDVALPTTTAKGRITGPDGAPVVMAEVRVKGSGEQTFSDGQGHYLLTGLETGSRTVLVSAQGYQPASSQVELRQPGQARTLNFTLVPATS